LNGKFIEELSKALSIPAAQVTAQVTAQVEAMLSAADSSPKTHEELLSAVGVKHREHFRKTYVDPLLKYGWIERTIPDKPTSSLQKYRTTEKGRVWLAERKK
jgi:ATP-dependent DNA helicase RecG